MYSQINSRNWYIIALSALVFIMFYSINIGYVSPDSWNYLRLANALIEQGSCSINGEYFSVFPCGYPASIALISTLSAGLDTFAASKISNLIFLSASFFLIHRASGNLLLSFLIIVNPITLDLYHFTFSENAFLFSFSLSFYTISKIHKHGITPHYAILLTLALIFGISARYAFGPFAFLMFITCIIVYGKSTSLKIFPYFALAGITYISYLAFNHYQTGYSTGMPRIPAPESLSFLIMYFGYFNALSFLKIAIAASPVIYVIRSELISTIKAPSLPENIKNNPLSFIFVLGSIFLIVLFYLRTQTQYDLYNARTAGYSLVFIYASAITYIFNKNTPVLKTSHIVLTAILSILVSQPKDYFKTVTGTQTYIDFSELMDAYTSKIENASAVYSPLTPAPAEHISVNKSAFYNGAAIIEADMAPYYEPDTLSSFNSKIAQYKEGCFYDFTHINDKDQLDKKLSETFRSGIGFRGSSFMPEIVHTPRLTEELRQHLHSVFIPGKAVPCQ